MPLSPPDSRGARRWWWAWLVVGFAGVSAALTVVVQRDRAALVEQFTAEREQQLGRVATSVSDALTDVSDDVRFAGELLAQPGALAEHEPELRALLQSVGKYKALAAFDRDGREVFLLVDSRAGPAARAPSVTAALSGLAAEALRRPPGAVVTSSSIADDETEWLRIFGTAAADAAGEPLGAVVVLVDVGPLFTPLRALEDERASRLLVLGAHGRPLPMSAPALADAARAGGSAATGSPALDEVVAHMRAGRCGRLKLDAMTAARLGLPPVEVVGAYQSLAVRGGAPWSVAFFTSTEALRVRERALLLRLAVVAALLAALFALLGASLARARRRTAELVESQRHATELAHAHEVTRRILDHVPTGVLALGRDGTVTAWNQALESRLHGLRAGLTLEATFSGGAEPSVARLAELVATARATRHVASAVAEPLALFGERGFFTVHAIPLEQPDPELACLVVVDDHTQVRALEAQLVRAEKLSTVGGLAAGIAHEIGTPLGVVRGRAEYIAAKLGALHPQTAGLAVIVEQIDRVSRTMRQLLDFSREQPVRAGPTPLVVAFESLRGLLALEAEHRGLTLNVVPPPDLAVAADPDQLQQVLVNLVLNALDASTAGGAVRLSASPDDGAGRASIEVRDQGVGIATGDLARIFDPFWTTKKRGQGTGLGLAVVAQVVRNHGGVVSVASAPGEGTTVTVHWPLAGAAPQEAAPA